LWIKTKILPKLLSLSWTDSSPSDEYMTLGEVYHTASTQYLIFFRNVLLCSLVWIRPTAARNTNYYVIGKAIDPSPCATSFPRSLFSPSARAYTREESVELTSSIGFTNPNISATLECLGSPKTVWTLLKIHRENLLFKHFPIFNLAKKNKTKTKQKTIRPLAECPRQNDTLKVALYGTCGYNIYEHVHNNNRDTRRSGSAHIGHVNLCSRK